MYWKYIGNILECIGVYWEYIGICWKYHLKTNFRFKIQNTKCLNIKRYVKRFTLSELFYLKRYNAKQHWANWTRPVDNWVSLQIVEEVKNIKIFEQVKNIKIFEEVKKSPIS